MQFIQRTQDTTHGANVRNISPYVGKKRKSGKNLYIPWSQAEINLFKKLYPVMGNKTLALEFGRSLWSIKAKANELGLRKSKPPKKDPSRKESRYLPCEVQVLVSLYPFTPNREIAEMLGRPLGSIRQKAKDLKLRKATSGSRRVYKHIGTRRPFTELEKEYIRTHYATMHPEDIASVLDRRTPDVVRLFARHNGLTKAKKK